MSEQHIFSKIAEQALKLTEQDIDEWIVPQLCEHFSLKIKALARFAYGSTIHRNGDGLSVSLQAFRERARAEIRSAVYTFLFVSEHWRNNRDLNTYLLTCLGRLARGIHNDVDGQRRINVPICPACRFYGQREYLRNDGKLLRCEICYSSVDRLESSPEKALRTIFAIHSRSGYRCTDCERFIPKSLNGSSCPYNDCSWFGNIDSLEIMTHPLGLGLDQPISLNKPISQNIELQNNTLQDYLESSEISADSNLEIEEKFKIELEALNYVIDAQMGSIQRTENFVPSNQKFLMYQAYKNLIKNQPEDMVSYLVHLKHSGVTSPIQSRIFQEYVRLVENALPFTILRGGQEAEICSLLDPNLNLFLGISEFDATVRSDNVVPNNTIETYTGGRQLKFFGPCFIGLLIDVVDKKNGESLRNKVKTYSFMQISMSDDVFIGTAIKVTHFRIASHYELGPMVNLQRIRRKIVDSVYYKLNHEKRKINET